MDLGARLVSLLARRRGGRAGHGASEALVAWANAAVDAGDSIPERLQGTYDAVVKLTDRFCAEHLDDEYAAVLRRLAAAMARKHSSPISRGKSESWACGIAIAAGSVNFLFDTSQQPHMDRASICKAFGVSLSNASAKATTIRKALDLMPLDPRFCVRSKVEDNPLSWLIEINGMVADARMLPRTLQRRALELGLIPHMPRG